MRFAAPDIATSQWVAYVLWAAFFVLWFGVGLRAARTEATPGIQREASYRLLNVVGGVMLFWPPHTTFTPPLWTNPEAVHWAMLALMLAGFGFCWWARRHLGKLWSGSITRKEGHRVVDTGPYALVRHPIYTGLILSAAALAVKSAAILNFAGVAVFIFSWWMKARLEEKFLAEELGAEAYAAYRARVPMLVPFMRIGRSASGSR